MKITTTYLIDDASVDVEQKVSDKLNEGLKSIPGYTYTIQSSEGWTDYRGWYQIFCSVGDPCCLYPDVYLHPDSFQKMAIWIGCCDRSLYTTRLWYFHSSPYSMVSCRFSGNWPGFHRGDSDGNGLLHDWHGGGIRPIREFVGVHHHAADQKKVINDALNATLSRTINTSLTIFFVLLAIFIFGGEVIRGFTFALLIGIVIGTYSSICIATPIVVDFSKKDKAW